LERIGLLVNTGKPQSIAAGKRLLPWLEARGKQPVLQSEEAILLGRSDLALRDGQSLGQTDLLIVIGGDGTLIGAAKLVAEHGTPILGINTGRLGFLTEIETADDLEQLAPILAGQFQIEKRMMLEASVQRDGETVYRQVGLNEAVVARGALPLMLQVEIGIGGHHLSQFPADGVIIGTPTGSTAYSLAAGGPILAPDLDLLLITPICSHAFGPRAIVVSASEEITVSASTRGEALIYVDGSFPFHLLPTDVVRVRRSPYSANLVRRDTYRFYGLVRQKFSHRTS
jgi:NAD+ kinase